MYITTKQKNNSIIILIAILIIGFFYVKLKKDPGNFVIEKEVTPQVNNSISTTGENINDTGAQANPVSAKKEDVEKFDLALSNGSKEFLAKNYDNAISYYKEALNYKDSDEVYVRLFTIYSAQNNLDDARLSLEKAIKLNPSYTDYRVSKLLFLDEKTSSSFIELKTVYNEALSKVDTRTKINLVTAFSRIAERNNEKSEAIKLWEYAIEIYPQNKDVYQKEIEKLR